MQLEYTEAKLMAVQYEKKAISSKIDRCEYRQGLAEASYPRAAEFRHHLKQQRKEMREEEAEAAQLAAEEADEIAKEDDGNGFRAVERVVEGEEEH